MEIKKNSRHRGSISRLICPLLAFALAVGLIVASPGPVGEAKAVDLETKCSLTVKPGGEEQLEDLKEANVVVDIYKVAKAVAADNGQDTYYYQFLDGYEELGKDYAKNPDNELWKRMAQMAAGYVLKNETAAISKGAPVDKIIEDLECGLYLVVARGADIEDYQTTVKDQDGIESIATIARSKSYEYTFAPELVSLPSKQETAEDGTQTNTTGGNGQWDYNMTITLKPERKDRAGSLEIVKNLATYDINDPAVFVFQVEAEIGGKNVYSDVVTMVFTEAGQKKVVLDKIPAGATVKVTEIYSGASYEVTSADEQTATINVADVASVIFDNDHSTTNHGGGGVNNHFTYDSVDGWQLEQQPANRTAGE